MIKTTIAISLICLAAALPWDEENPWSKLLDDQANDELDFIQNDGRSRTKYNCCNIDGYVYEKDLNGMRTCIRSVGVVIFPSSTLSNGRYLKKTTIFLGNYLILHNGSLYVTDKPPARCTTLP
ncbi:Hypothetical predicted protein [Paramuricea clavata]|uniref:Uncharacterized protein n=1 Tax=Paramuricea clavata TaxID=317549 RepID=A0A6S7HEL1_PARCT|nr:Hypothetical predicted protein [Paramuricea clavata]